MAEKAPGQGIAAADLAALQRAKQLLENPGLAARIVSLVGTPVERGLARLPANWHRQIGEITQGALLKAADAAHFTLQDRPGEGSSNTWHTIGAAVSGGVGGFFGMSALAVELPVSTTIMLRSIADIARSEGEAPGDPAVKLACLEVFALGGSSRKDDGAESGYYPVRAALAKSVADAAEFLATRSLRDAGSPVLLRFITRVADRFSIQITQKAAAQAVPAIGAAGGALINTVFMAHCQDMAQGHFAVRRLERKYGVDAIRTTYAALPLQD